MGVYLNSSFPVFQKFRVLLRSLGRGKKNNPETPRNLNSASAVYYVIKLQPELAHTAEVVSDSLDKRTCFHLLTNLFPNTLLLLWCLYVEVDSSPSPLTHGPG